MNKNTIIYAAIVVSIAMAGFIVFSGQQDFENQYTSLKASGELSKTVNPTKDVEVKYQTTTKPAHEKAHEREKFVESKTMDAAKKFEISLINEQTWDSKRQAPVVLGVSGKIDNSPFSLMVPSYLVTDNSEVKIRIKNTSTGEEKTLFAPFIKELTTRSAGTNLNINSSDVSNYSFEQKPGILPGPGLPPSIPNN